MRLLVDAPKRAANLAKHGFDLVDADKFDRRSARYVDAKLGREKAIGLLCNTIVVVIFKRLGSDALSVISLRPASRRERKDYGAR